MQSMCSATEITVPPFSQAEAQGILTVKMYSTIDVVTREAEMQDATDPFLPLHFEHIGLAPMLLHPCLRQGRTQISRKTTEASPAFTAFFWRGMHGLLFNFIMCLETLTTNLNLQPSGPSFLLLLGILNQFCAVCSSETRSDRSPVLMTADAILLSVGSLGVQDHLKGVN